MGGDAPNEDEYSAALERLLEGCPPSTHASSQIGGAATGGGGVLPFTFGEWGKAKWKEQVWMIRATVGPRRYMFLCTSQAN